jgi:Domain of unknown function (DUF6265)
MTRLCRNLCIAAGAGLIAVCATAQAGPCTLAGLSWMAGNWHNADDPAGAQERWTPAPGGVLMGSSFEAHADGTGYAEAMTIRQDGTAILMVLRHFDLGLKRAWEEREAPMIFAAATCESNAAVEDRAVFDGQGDHQGEHLTYKRSGESLLIVGDFLHHGKPDHEEWHMVLGKD